MPEGFPKVLSRTIRQRTITRSIPCRGIGLHSGRKVEMVIKPGPVGSGIVFLRTDIAASNRAASSARDPLIPARWDRVVDTRLCTVIANDDGARIGTVEHLMAALAGCGVDNAVIEVDADEVPVMDGSSEPFVALIESVGTVEQGAPRRAIEILSPVHSGDDQRMVSFRPAPLCSIDFEIAFDSAAIGRQRYAFDLVPGSFRRELSRARTFGFFSDIEQLRAHGLARGGSLENAVVVDGDIVMNEGGLRYEDEFVRHKILDCVGDLYLAGGPIMGAVTALRAGHMANNLALRALFDDPSAYRWVDMTEDMFHGTHALEDLRVSA
jgi:UDP-3-O-[3-hydroxymyristoyl] N-acetylglucosamine deacetylase